MNTTPTPGADKATDERTLFDAACHAYHGGIFCSQHDLDYSWNSAPGFMWRAALAGAPDDVLMLKREIHNLKRHIEDYCPAPAGAVVARPDLANRLHLLDTAIEEVRALIPQRLGAEHLREKLQSIVRRAAHDQTTTGEKK
jgi:hypothetical protein